MELMPGPNSPIIPPNQSYGKQSKVKLDPQPLAIDSVHSTLGQLSSNQVKAANCGDAVALAINNGLKAHGGTEFLPRGGLGPGDIAKIGKAYDAPITNRNAITLDSLRSSGPGTIIRMTRSPGDKNYEYGTTHAETVGVNPATGAIGVASYTAGKGLRWKDLDEKYISELPKQTQAVNPFRAVAPPSKPTPLSRARMMTADTTGRTMPSQDKIMPGKNARITLPDGTIMPGRGAKINPPQTKSGPQEIKAPNAPETPPPRPVEGEQQQVQPQQAKRQPTVDLTMGLDKPPTPLNPPTGNFITDSSDLLNKFGEHNVKAGYNLVNAPVQALGKIIGNVLNPNYQPEEKMGKAATDFGVPSALANVASKITDPLAEVVTGTLKGMGQTVKGLTNREEFDKDMGVVTNAALIAKGAKEIFKGKGEPSKTAGGILDDPKYQSGINTLIQKSIRPNFGKGTTSTVQQARYMARTRKGLETIVKNKGNLNILDESGERVALPETLNQAQQAHGQTMEQHFRKWDAMAKSAQDKGVRVAPDSIIKELQEVINDKVLQREDPTGTAYAQKKLADYTRWQEEGGMTPLEAQKAIRISNERTDAWYKNPSPDTVGNAAMDARIAHLLRKAQDDAITKTEGTGYQPLKNEYRDLETFERDLNRRTWVHARQSPKGFFDLSDMASGGVSMYSMLMHHPAGLVTGIGMKAISQYNKYMNNPNRMIKSLFAKVDDAVHGSMAEGLIRARTPFGKWENAKIPEEQKLLPPGQGFTTGVDRYNVRGQSANQEAYSPELAGKLTQKALPEPDPNKPPIPPAKAGPGLTESEIEASGMTRVQKDALIDEMNRKRRPSGPSEAPSRSAQESKRVRAGRVKLLPRKRQEWRVGKNGKLYQVATDWKEIGGEHD